MPRIFDNIDQQLLPALRETLELSATSRLLRRLLQPARLEADRRATSNAGRVATGIAAGCWSGWQRFPRMNFELRSASLRHDEEIDNQTALRLKKRARRGVSRPAHVRHADQRGRSRLRRLASQIKARKSSSSSSCATRCTPSSICSIFQHPINPIVGYLGSSNLTLAGLVQAGRTERRCARPRRLREAGEVVRGSLERPLVHRHLRGAGRRSSRRAGRAKSSIPPYHIYVKMAYHLSQEARAGLSEFRIPRDFGDKLFDFQTAAVKIAAHHLNKRGGVLIGDVVGLGKTLMATALARSSRTTTLETLIICPKNLVQCGRTIVDQYRLSRRVLSISRAISELPEPAPLSPRAHRREPQPAQPRGQALPRHPGIHPGKRQQVHPAFGHAVQQDLPRPVESASPVRRRKISDLGIRPEKLLRELGETEFIRRHQCPVRSLAAFEKSEYADDWRELMRLYLVRRTRSFIQDNYAETDPANGRKYLTFEDGTRSYFPTRMPKTVEVHDRRERPDRPVRPALRAMTWSTRSTG